MDIDNLAARLAKAYETQGMSLRKLAEICDVSHELVRKLINFEKVNLTSDKFSKIDKGLRDNEF